ncbi:dienelactone hydrolase family protein [Balneolaceae bacterium ANBcel3]|nr:dienelactone hydrolase family protein [Balneolaceae bacterium ANBcel3]
MSYYDPNDPHAGQPVLEKGEPLEKAKAAVILMHGRGASAESILSLESAINIPDVAWLAPQAATNAWYPYTFLSPVDQNEPGYSSSLLKMKELIDRVAEAGIPHERIILAGFSQGACLASEFAGRFPSRFGGVVVLSGGLIGDTVEKERYQGDLKGTPVFIGCSDIDAHIPVERVHETAEILDQLNGNVTKKIYPGMGHIVNEEELEFFERMLRSIVESER